MTTSHKNVNLIVHSSYDKVEYLSNEYLIKVNYLLFLFL